VHAYLLRAHTHTTATTTTTTTTTTGKKIDLPAK
jgi:hypothetical protein